MNHYKSYLAEGQTDIKAPLLLQDLSNEEIVNELLAKAEKKERNIEAYNWPQFIADLHQKRASASPQKASALLQKIQTESLTEAILANVKRTSETKAKHTKTEDAYDWEKFAEELVHALPEKDPNSEVVSESQLANDEPAGKPQAGNSDKQEDEGGNDQKREDTARAMPYGKFDSILQLPRYFEWP